MKKTVCLVTILSAFATFASDSDLEPTIYADISESAQEAAITFDGVRGFAGLVLQSIKYQSRTENNSTQTENKINMFGLSIGVEYAKAFRQGFLIGFDVSADINKKKKKEGNWKALNAAYDADTSTIYVGVDDLKTGKLETEAITPNISLKVGYLLPKFKSLLFLKAGISKLGGTYHYNFAGANVCKVDVSKFIPVIGLGAEYKINSRWGAALEANMSLKKTCTKRLANIQHKIKIGRQDIRIMGTYRISND